MALSEPRQSTDFAAPQATVERTSAATWLKGVAGMFAAEGLALPPLFAAAGLDLSHLDDPQARYDADAISVLWEQAVARSGKPNLGLTRALAARYGNFDLLGHVMLSSPTLLAGLQRVAEAIALVSNGATFAVQPAGDTCALVLGHQGTRRPVPRQRTEFGLLTILMLCNWLAHEELQPLAAEFVFPLPPSVAPYTEAFGCPVRFAQPQTRLLLRTADLSQPLPSHNPSILALHEQALAHRLQDLGDQCLASQVRRLLLRALPQGEPRREQIARQLCLTDRTLRRRLLAEHTSFQQLLDAVRVELARTYLADNRHSLTEVSDLLGFGNQSNFFRACKRWFGQPPGLYRSHLLGGAGPPG